MRLVICIVLAAALFATPGAHAGALTQDQCAGTVQGPVVWADLGFGHVLENLLFHEQGAMWVSDGSVVHRFYADKSEAASLTKTITSAGGLATGEDGWIYVGSGNSLANSAMRSGAASVLRFNPTSPNETVQTYASGFNMPNGMTFDPAGNLYISNDLDIGLVKIAAPADGRPASWSLLNDTWGTNGLVVIGDELYSAITFDQRSPIEVTDLNTGAHHTAVQLTAGAVSLQPNVYTNGDAGRPAAGVKGLDDMTRDAAGNLYPVANGTGELLRVDPQTGDACLIAGGLQNPSSVRIAPESGDFADHDPATIDFYITEFSGQIKTVRFAPAA
jgi:sugar lactone lactonase YvrE